MDRLPTPRHSHSSGSGETLHPKEFQASPLAEPVFKASRPLQIPSRKLNTGAIAPGIGYGMGGEGKETEAELYAAVRVAIDAGYRCFDCAPLYYDGEVERVLGRAIRDCGVDRSQFFIMTKIWPTYSRKPQKSLELSLGNLGLDYVDCLLLHWPIPLKPVPEQPYALGSVWDAAWDYKKSWIEMQKLPKAQTRAIGLCNFTVNRLKQLLSSPAVNVVPAVLQVEGHPELPQDRLMRFCRDKNIQLVYSSPLGKNRLNNGVIDQIAHKHGVSPAQIAISWAVHRGTIPLPKSTTQSRIIQNISIVKLSLDDIDMLSTLGKNPRRLVNPRLFFGHDIFENNIDSYEDEDVVYEEPTKRIRR